MKVVKELPLSIFHSVKLMCTSKKKLNDPKKKVLPVIVSLTSIPSRLPTLHLVIKSLLVQPCRPKKIVLWLNEKLRVELPKSLQKLPSDIFEVRFSKIDCSHLKLIESLKAFPDDVIITCDDDLFYRKNWLQFLFEEHQKNPKDVIGIHTLHINYDKHEEPKTYKQWTYPDGAPNVSAIIALGSWGVLYPPNCLSEKVHDIDLLMQLAPKHDDLWFKAMELLKGTRIRQATKIPKTPIPIIGSQKIALKKENVANNKNDVSWKKLSAHFNLKEIIIRNPKNDGIER